MGPQSIKENLKAIGEELPRGAFTEIAEACKCSPQYVSQFFKGMYSITSDNAKILDWANKILDREKKAHQKVERQINEMLSKGKE